MTIRALFHSHSENSESHSQADKEGQLFSRCALVWLYTLFTAGSLLIGQYSGIWVANYFDLQPGKEFVSPEVLLSKRRLPQNANVVSVEKP